MGIAVSPIQIDSRVSDFIGKPRKMLINGKWVNAASGKTFPPVAPQSSHSGPSLPHRLDATRCRAHKRSFRREE